MVSQFWKIAVDTVHFLTLFCRQLLWGPLLYHIFIRPLVDKKLIWDYLIKVGLTLWNRLEGSFIIDLKDEIIFKKHNNNAATLYSHMFNCSDNINKRERKC